MQNVTSHHVKKLNGTANIPGDKSISHRSLMLGAMAVGETRISHLLEGEDVYRTADALRSMGVSIVRDSTGEWRVQGVGVGGLHSPETILDMGNSGTSTRLLMGLLASQPVRCILNGDASLRRRPMRRVIDPLSRFGASFDALDGERLPLSLQGATDPIPIDYTTPIASAQIKSAILFAALNTPGRTYVRETKATRDHSERMLKAMGAKLHVDYEGDGRIIWLEGEEELRPLDITVPGDISSAAFPLVAAAMHPGSTITLQGVGINPLRTGILDALAQMGAHIEQQNERLSGEEPVADLILTAPDDLRAIDLDPVIVPRMVDEFPVLFVAAACAKGTSHFRGLEELRVKESDRIAAMVSVLKACGVKGEERPDGLIIHGTGKAPVGGGRVKTHLDHRIAMAALVLGCATENPVVLDNAAPINTSFPDFGTLMNGLGADMRGL